MVSWLPLADLLADERVGGLDPDRVERVFGEVEQRIERYHLRAWVPRAAVERRRGRGTRNLWLRHRPARDLTAVTIDGDAVDLAEFVLWPSRLERPGFGFPAGADIEVAYGHGEDGPPADLLSAAITATATLVGHEANVLVSARTETVVAEGRRSTSRRSPTPNGAGCSACPTSTLSSATGDAAARGWADDPPVLHRG